jgi:acetyl-CoA acetyltransferase
MLGMNMADMLPEEYREASKKAREAGDKWHEEDNKRHNRVASMIIIASGFATRSNLTSEEIAEFSSQVFSAIEAKEQEKWGKERADLKTPEEIAVELEMEFKRIDAERKKDERSAKLWVPANEGGLVAADDDIVTEVE